MMPSFRLKNKPPAGASGHSILSQFKLLEPGRVHSLHPLIASMCLTALKPNSKSQTPSPLQTLTQSAECSPAKPCSGPAAQELHASGLIWESYTPLQPETSRSESVGLQISRRFPAQLQALLSLRVLQKRFCNSCAVCSALASAEADGLFLQSASELRALRSSSMPLRRSRAVALAESYLVKVHVTDS